MTTEPRNVVLDVDNLACHFHTGEGTVKAVDGVSLRLHEREILGIVGESGSGKSVTQLAMMGLIPKPPGEIVSGTAKFLGQDLLTLGPRELRKLRGNRISMIFQDPMTSLNPFMRISRQLEEVLEVHTDMTAAQRRERCLELLRAVGLPDPERRYRSWPHEFSGGMRQRVMIAMALLCNPALLVADEPTTALDVTIQAQILQLIRKLRDEFGTSVVFITHDLGVVAGITDRVLVMYAGRVMERADTATLYARPTHPYTIGLLRSVPRLDRPAGSANGADARLIPIPGLPPDPARLPAGCPFAPRCPFATDQCRAEFPERKVYAEHDGGEHEVFCWRADEIRAMSVEERDDAAAARAAELTGRRVKG
ncbi:MAG: ABC transporter ATP-binding protein [Planctomycetota bacterium]